MLVVSNNCGASFASMLLLVHTQVVVGVDQTIKRQHCPVFQVQIRSCTFYPYSKCPDFQIQIRMMYSYSKLWIGMQTK